MYTIIHVDRQRAERRCFASIALYNIYGHRQQAAGAIAANSNQRYHHDREDTSSIVITGATANTTESESRI